MFPGLSALPSPPVFFWHCCRQPLTALPAEGHFADKKCGHLPSLMVIAVSRCKEEEECPHAFRIKGLETTVIVTPARTVGRVPSSSFTRKIRLPRGVQVAEASSIHARRGGCCCGGGSPRLHRIDSRRSGGGMRESEKYRRIRGMAHPICVGLADPRHSCSNAFPRYVIDVSRPPLIQEVACYPVITWDSVKGIRQIYPVVRSTRPSSHVEY